MSVFVVAQVLGAIGDFSHDGRRREPVTIASDDLSRRIVRVSSSAGDIGIRLQDGALLRDGDVVYADADRLVYVEVAADDLLVARPTTLEAAARLGHALGNRHLPVHFEFGEIVVRYDPLIEALLLENGVEFSRVLRKLDTPLRHAYAPHLHGAEAT